MWCAVNYVSRGCQVERGTAGTSHTARQCKQRCTAVAVSASAGATASAHYSACYRSPYNSQPAPARRHYYIQTPSHASQGLREPKERGRGRRGGGSHVLACQRSTCWQIHTSNTSTSLENSTIHSASTNSSQNYH